MSKYKALTIAAIAISMFLVVGVYAASAVSKKFAQYPPVVDKLAKRFDLNVDEVKKVFDEERKDHFTQHKARLDEYLDQAVKNKSIIAKQKGAIIKKMDELKLKMDDIKSASPEKRWESMQKLRTEIEKWAKDNKIDLKNIMPGYGGFMHSPGGHFRGMKGMRGFMGGGFGPGRGGGFCGLPADPK